MLEQEGCECPQQPSPLALASLIALTIIRPIFAGTLSMIRDCSQGGEPWGKGLDETLGLGSLNCILEYPRANPQDPRNPEK